MNDYNLKRGREICTATWVRKQYLNIKYSKQTNLIAYHLFNRCKKKNVRMQIQYNLLQSWKSECSVHLHNWDHKISGLKPLFKKKGDLTQQLNPASSSRAHRSKSHLIHTNSTSINGKKNLMSVHIHTGIGVECLPPSCFPLTQWYLKTFTSHKLLNIEL